MNATLDWKDLHISSDKDAVLSASEKSEKETNIRISWANQPEAPSHLEIHWSLPLLDIQYEWYPQCRMRRALHVDWEPPVKTRVSIGAPVFCFYNGAARNRFTMALSDVVSIIDCTLGVREEDGHLYCNIRVPLDRNDRTREYSLTLYRDTSDISFAEALRRVSAWWETDCGLTPMNVPEAARLPLYSAWYSFHQNTIASELEAECALAVKAGMKTIIVDDGWQTGDGSRGYGYCGDWEVCPEKIPDMRAHVKAVHDLGMKYMLWYSVPFVGEYSKHWEQFKDKILYQSPNPTFHAGVLDPRYPEVRQYLIDTYLRALKEWNLDGFKLDFIDSFRAASKTPAPNDSMDYTSVEEAVVRLMSDIMRSLRAVKEDILIEFRQSYIGPAMRTYGNMFRVGDCPADAITNRVGVVDLRLLSGNTAVHSDMLMWHKDDPVENAARQILSAIFGVVQISVRLEEMPADHLQMISFWTDFMARHRDLLSAPIEVESPHNLYPLVRSRLGNEEAVALYDRHVVTLSDASTVYLFNATADESLVLRSLHRRAMHAQVFDCMGRAVCSMPLDSLPLHELSVPVSGYVLLTLI